MKLKYIYSACAVIETPDIRIASDPWFTPGADIGSWLHYPPLDKNPINIIGEVDAIYISHVHADHYDPIFLRQYLEVYPKVRFFITNGALGLLARRMTIDGFKFEQFETKKVKNTEIHIIPCESSELDHDTACVVTHGNQSIVNMNDNHISPKQIEKICATCPNGRPTAALLPYTGAGPFPQTYYFESEIEQNQAAEQKKQQFLGVYSEYIDRLNPEVAIPFAGKFVLMGPLARHNNLRGYADAVDVLNIPKYKDASIVLEDNGKGILNLENMKATAVRTKPYDLAKMNDYIAKYPFPGYHYEQEFKFLDNRPLPLLNLLKVAYKRALERSPTNFDYWVCLRTKLDSPAFVFNTCKNQGVSLVNDITSLKPRIEVEIDPRLLFGILTGYYHWEEMDGGSHTMTRRVPMDFRIEVYDFLRYLAAAP